MIRLEKNNHLFLKTKTDICTYKLYCMVANKMNVNSSIRRKNE